MKKLFLSSSFPDVVDLFAEYTNGELKGKKVTFIPTASLTGKDRSYVEMDRQVLLQLGLIPDVLEVSSATAEEITEKLTCNDCIYIVGGNTFFLLQELKKAGADKIIAEQVNKGKLYIGASAGSVVISPNIEYIQYMDEIEAAPSLSDYSSLGLVDIYPVPHIAFHPFKKATDKIISEYKTKLDLYPIKNNQAIIVEGDQILVMTAKPKESGKLGIFRRLKHAIK